MGLYGVEEFQKNVHHHSLIDGIEGRPNVHLDEMKVWAGSQHRDVGNSHSAVCLDERLLEGLEAGKDLICSE